MEVPAGVWSAKVGSMLSSIFKTLFFLDREEDTVSFLPTGLISFFLSRRRGYFVAFYIVKNNKSMSFAIYRISLLLRCACVCVS